MPFGTQLLTRTGLVRRWSPRPSASTRRSCARESRLSSSRTCCCSRTSCTITACLWSAWRSWVPSDCSSCFVASCERRCVLFQRVMPTSFFLLLRFFLRVDGVLIRINDTRLYHEAGNNHMLREFSTRESQMSDLKVSETAMCFCFECMLMIWSLVPCKHAHDLKCCSHTSYSEEVYLIISSHWLVWRNQSSEPIRKECWR